MGLENLSTAFNDLSKNSMEPQKVTSANSPAKSKEADGDNFKYHSLFYQEDTLFRTKTQNLLSKNTEYDKLEHTFASQGQYDDIIKIKKITQDASPMSPRLVSYVNPNGPENSVLENQYVQRSDASIDIRSSFVNGEDIGTNRQLGIDKFVLESLYRTDHRGAANREPIPLNRTDNDGNPLFVNTLRSGMGSFKGLNIKGYSSTFRTGLIGDGEPYIVNKIGAKNFGGNNRDILPFNQTLEDVSRLAQFYTSFAGLFFMGRENLTNFAIKFPTKDPLRTVDILRSKALAPPIPVPMTGLLNFYHQTAQAPGGVNLRKPLTSEYSKRPQNLIPFEQLGDRPIVNSLPPGTLKEKAVNKQTPFHDLGGGNKPYNQVDVFSNARVFSEADRNTFSQIYENHGDFYVRIKDLRTNTYLYFRGFVTGITENVTPTFSPTRYIGRSEQVHVYSHGERDLSFNLRVAPQNEHQFKLMYEKLGALTSLAYPQYKQEKYLAVEAKEDQIAQAPDITEGGDPVYNEETGEYEFPNATVEASETSDVDVTDLSNDDVFRTSQGQYRMLAPFCELYMAHIGNKAKGQFGYFKSLTYTVSEQGDWDALTQLPRVFDIAISYQILHRKAPSMATGFYGVQVKYPDQPPAPGNRLSPDDLLNLENRKIVNDAKFNARIIYDPENDPKSNNPGTRKLQNAKTDLAKKQNFVPTIIPSPPLRRTPGSPDLVNEPPEAVAVPNLPLPGDPVPTNTV